MVPCLTSLPIDILAALPLSVASWKALSSTCRSMRAAAVRAWCSRGVRVPEHVLEGKNGAMDLSSAVSMHVVGPWTAALWTVPSPMPIATHMPFLRVLHLYMARVSDDSFWTLVFDNAPALEIVTFCAVYVGEMRDPSLRACDTLLRLGDRRLRGVRFEGVGLVMPSRSTPAALTPAALTPVYLSEATSAVFHSRHYLPTLDAAHLRSLDIEDGEDSMVARLGPGVLASLQWLRWSTPDPSAMANVATSSLLVDLDLSLHSIQCVRTFTRALQSLAYVPVSVTKLSVCIDFDSTNSDNPSLSYTNLEPLKHLIHVRVFDLRVSFATMGCGVLIRRVLGLPTGTARRISIHAVQSPSNNARGEFAEAMEDGADPDDPDIQQWSEAMDDIDAACSISPADIDAARLTYAPALVYVTGFPVQNMPYPPP